MTDRPKLPRGHKRVAGRLTRVDRRRTSHYGNPTYALTLDDTTEYLTQTDASCAYEVANYRIGRRVELTMTAADRVYAITYENGERA